MTNCLSIKDALDIAEFTGQVVKITLCSGRQLRGVVEKVCPTAFRIWIDPEELCSPEDEIKKAWVAIHAVESVAFDCDSKVEGSCCKCLRQGDLQGIRKALIAAELTKQVVKVGLNCNGESVKVKGKIIKVSCSTFCIKLEECNDVKEEKIANVEFVKFS
jgi:uncharacterized protein Veg